jgi:hypothetical protein
MGTYHRCVAETVARFDGFVADLVAGAGLKFSPLRTKPTHHARASSGRKSRRDDGRLPSFKRAVSNLQLWCTLNVCTSSVDLH